ncbi:MAG: response regulator [Ignavibacteriales bacterium]|nr:response regulator [Ignavibacteriales bacterium]
MRHKILVIDDENGKLELIKDAFEVFSPNLEILSFSCPEETYENIRSNGEDIPLIVLDIMIDADGKNSGGINRLLFFYLSLRGENVRAFIAKHNIKLNESDEQAIFLDKENVSPIKGNTKVAILTYRWERDLHISELKKTTDVHQEISFLKKLAILASLNLFILYQTIT